MSTNDQFGFATKTCACEVSKHFLASVALGRLDSACRVWSNLKLTDSSLNPKYQNACYLSLASVKDACSEMSLTKACYNMSSPDFKGNVRRFQNLQFDNLSHRTQHFKVPSAPLLTGGTRTIFASVRIPYFFIFQRKSLIGSALNMLGVMLSCSGKWQNATDTIEILRQRAKEGHPMPDTVCGVSLL